MDKETENRRRRSCWEVARGKRAQARRNGHGRAKAQLVFLVALLSSILLPSSPVHPIALRPGAPDRPPNDYERGYSSSSSTHNGYRTRPSLRKLMKDLHRPGGKAKAREFLLSRIPAPELRCWVADKIDEGRLSELAMHIRPDLPEQEIFARWRSASIADAESETDDHDPSRKGPGGGGYRRGL